jgi:hypothetical protein
LRVGFDELGLRRGIVALIGERPPLGHQLLRAGLLGINAGRLLRAAGRRQGLRSLRDGRSGKLRGLRAAGVRLRGLRDGVAGHRGRRSGNRTARGDLDLRPCGFEFLDELVGALARVPGRIRAVQLVGLARHLKGAVEVVGALGVGARLRGQRARLLHELLGLHLVGLGLCGLDVLAQRRGGVVEEPPLAAGVVGFGRLRQVEGVGEPPLGERLAAVPE